MATIIYTIIAIWVSSWVADTFNSGLFGFVCFWFFLPGYKLVIATDLAFFVYSDHHKRNDRRAAKMVESQLYMTREQTEELLDREFLGENYRPEKKVEIIK